MTSLENRIPPPLVMLIFALLMWLLTQLGVGFELVVPMNAMVATLVALIGLGFGVAGSIAFKKAATTINPLRPDKASSLVTSGVYKFTRNPMYVGLSLLLLAWSVYLTSVLALLCLPLFMFYINRFQIVPEERALNEKFGAEFERYQSQVRRWL